MPSLIGASPSTRYDFDVRGSLAEQTSRDIRVKEEQRDKAQEGLRMPTGSDVRDVREERDRPRRASEPRTYTKRPRSEGRRDREERQKDRGRRRE